MIASWQESYDKPKQCVKKQRPKKKSKDITLLTKVHIVKAMIFPVVMYGCENWAIKKVERWRIDALELWCWRRLLRVPWTARSNQSILREIIPEYSLEELMLKLKLQYFGYLMQTADSLSPWCWERLRAEGEESVRWWDSWMASLMQWTWIWQTLGDDEGHRGLTCCSPWGPKQSDTSGWLNNNNKEL